MFIAVTQLGNKSPMRQACMQRCTFSKINMLRCINVALCAGARPVHGQQLLYIEHCLLTLQCKTLMQRLFFAHKYLSLRIFNKIMFKLVNAP